MASPLTADVTRGTCRLLFLQGLAIVPEVPLANGRRVDVMGLSPQGEIWLVEVKTALSDLAGDRKWEQYLGWCDRFFWAVPQALAPELGHPRFRPETSGLIIADAHEGVLARPALLAPLPPARRKAVTLLLARTAALRSHRTADPLWDGFAAW
ncbi:MAG: MmcB family DNA repair protein [Sphingomonadaceae bacterium]